MQCFKETVLLIRFNCFPSKNTVRTHVQRNCVLLNTSHLLHSLIISNVPDILKALDEALNFGLF